MDPNCVINLSALATPSVIAPNKKSVAVTVAIDAILKVLFLPEMNI